MTDKEMILKALDELEDLRQKLYEGSLDDYDFRVAAANIAQIIPDEDFHNRVNWCDMLKADETSKYHQRYYHGVFH